MLARDRDQAEDARDESAQQHGDPVEREHGLSPCPIAERWHGHEHEHIDEKHHHKRDYQPDCSPAASAGSHHLD